MGENLSKIMIRTILNRGLREMQDDPDRSIRKLVDMAATFAIGPFQKQFFRTAQQMLEVESSGYYRLVRNLVHNTAQERLITFGMNIGYNGCTVGAGRIRRLEEKEGFNIPWSLSLEIYADAFAQRESWYRSLIAQGEELGIFCWVLFPDREPERLLDIIRDNPDSSFAIISPEGTDIRQLIEEGSDCKNLMVAIPYDDFADCACDMLKESGMLYSLYFRYNADSAMDITEGVLFEQMECLDPAFCAMIPERNCPENIQEQVHQAVMTGRMSQKYHTVLWEYFRDSMLVDGVISEEACWVGLDGDGNFHGRYPHGCVTVPFQQEESLKELLRSAGGRT